MVSLRTRYNGLLLTFWSRIFNCILDMVEQDCTYNSHYIGMQLKQYFHPSKSGCCYYANFEPGAFL